MKNCSFCYLKVCFIVLNINGFVYAQQNLFNIPSGDITPHGKVFIQQQVNCYGIANYESKTHFVVGLKRKFDVGLNIVNIPVNFKGGMRISSSEYPGKRVPLYPVVLVTGQKKIEVYNWFNVNMGAMVGANIPFRSQQYKEMFATYIVGNIFFSKKLRILSGLSYSNKYLVGNRSNLSYIGGYEYILSPRIYLMGDFISGSNSSSAAVVGLNVNVTKRFQICLGGLLANPEGKIKKGCVFEINILGYDLEH